MTNCSKCGSADTRPYTFRPPPPRRDGHKCTDGPPGCCTKDGLFCNTCRFVRELSGDGAQ